MSEKGAPSEARYASHASIVDAYTEKWLYSSRPMLKYWAPCPVKIKPIRDAASVSLAGVTFPLFSA